ncbi:unnamed protein product [Pneumocystis jirovecii]|uniref:WD repeat-containing protein JIP5 n=1 Tax=Pneumocystis jirovecii TaxID=42068 RepID=L0PCC0_PNEJI|nr:unnamed protein product [Pneumocystis jirovecii]
MGIEVDSEVFSIETHPSVSVFAVGTLTGRVSSYRYEGDLKKYERVWHTRRHRKACRDLKYSADGLELVSVGADGVIKCASSETGQVIWKKREAHEDAINVVGFMSKMMLATGDDNGYIKMWDSRTGACIKEGKVHNDFISSFLRCILKLVDIKSGDGTLSAHDFRLWKLLAVSENEDDFLSSCLVKSQSKNPKICIGTASGTVKIFNKGEWDKYADQILLYKKKSVLSVDSMISWNDDTIIVGGSNGVIQLLNIHPNRQMGIIGHQKTGVDVLAKTYDAKWILSGEDREINAWKVNWGVDGWENHETCDDTANKSLKHKKNILDNQTSFFSNLT